MTINQPNEILPGAQSAKQTPVRVMILEDDPWSANLIKQVVLSICPSLKVDCFDQVQDAEDAWEVVPYQLISAELNLFGHSTVGLLARIRQKDSRIPLVIVTDHADRASVLSVRPLKVSAFITKPFQMQRIVGCLEALIPHSDEKLTNQIHAENFDIYLTSLTEAELDLPMAGNIMEKLLKHLKGEQQNIRELTEIWLHDSGICARFIAVANSSAYNKGMPCLNQNDALKRLGLHTCLNMAMGMALRQSNKHSTSMLKSMIEAVLDQAECLAEQVTDLALRCGIDPAALQTAALLHQAGELCVLFSGLAWENDGNVLDKNQISQAIERFSGTFAVNLKANWRLPIGLRELIGAAYVLPLTQFRQEQVLMRLAAAKLHGEEASTIMRLERMSGLLSL